MHCVKEFLDYISVLENESMISSDMGEASRISQLRENVAELLNQKGDINFCSLVKICYGSLILSILRVLMALE